METLIEQIKHADNAYLVSLNEPRDGMGTHRYACYLGNGTSELSVLWPANTHSDKLWKKEIEEAGLYALKHASKRQYPAFHFALSGCGYSKTHEIGTQLRKINPNLKVFTIGGHMPSPVSL